MAYEIANKIVSGRKSTNAGSAVKLVANATPCYRVDLSADLGNDEPVVVGGATVVAASDAQKGIVLVPGNPVVTILVNDVSKIYVDVQVNGDAVCFNYYQQ